MKFKAMAVDWGTRTTSMCHVSGTWYTNACLSMPQWSLLSRNTSRNQSPGPQRPRGRRQASCKKINTFSWKTIIKKEQNYIVTLFTCPGSQHINFVRATVRRLKERRLSTVVPHMIRRSKNTIKFAVFAAVLRRGPFFSWFIGSSIPRRCVHCINILSSCGFFCLL